MATQNPSQAEIQAMITAAANQYGVPPALALAVAKTESGFNPSATNTNSNGTTDYGVMQINSSNVSALGLADPLDPEANINAGVQLLGNLLNQYNGNVQQALWAYNAGPGSVSSGSVPATTANYITTVLSNQDQFSTVLPSDSGLPVSSSDAGGGAIPDLLGGTVSIFGQDVPIAYVIAGGLLLAGLLASVLTQD